MFLQWSPPQCASLKDFFIKVGWSRSVGTTSDRLPTPIWFQAKLIGHLSPFHHSKNNACNNSYGFALNYLTALGLTSTCHWRIFASRFFRSSHRVWTKWLEEELGAFYKTHWLLQGYKCQQNTLENYTKKLQTSANDSLGESTYESLLRHAHKLSALAFFERGFFLWLIGLDAAMTILHESIWQTPRELSGVKSRKRPIFEIPLGSVDASSNAGIHRISGRRLSFVRLLKNVSCISLLKRSTLPRPNVLSAFWTCWASSFLASNMQPSWAKHQQHTLSWFALVVG